MKWTLKTDQTILSKSSLEPLITAMCKFFPRVFTITKESTTLVFDFFYSEGAVTTNSRAYCNVCFPKKYNQSLYFVLQINTIISTKCN